MTDKEIRKEIYKKLGLEFGSLPSESGNDWQRAKEEVHQEIKQKEFERNEALKKIDYLTIEKNSDEFISIINSNTAFTQNLRSIIAQRNDLEPQEINTLIKDSNKDIQINLARHQKLSPNIIDIMIPDSVYLTKFYLIENQALNENQKELLKQEMSKQPSLYTDLLERV